VTETTGERPGGRERGADTLDGVTTKLAPLLRRTPVVLLAGAVVLAAAGPAGAADSRVPEGWSDPDPVDPWNALLLLGVIPLMLFFVITVLVLLPGLIRGERRSGPATHEDQWFGGPRKGTAELPAPDSENSRAGGASGRW
jgi:hypothetical protein